MIATLTKFSDPFEAEIVRARLEAEGVPASVAFAGHSILHWPMSIALGGTAVQVPTEDLIKAKTILEEYYSGELLADLEESEGESFSLACPKCGSSQLNFGIPLRQRLGTLFLGIFTGAFFRTSQSIANCKFCGHSWDRRDS